MEERDELSERKEENKGRAIPRSKILDTALSTGEERDELSERKEGKERKGTAIPDQKS